MQSILRVWNTYSARRIALRVTYGILILRCTSRFMVSQGSAGVSDTAGAAIWATDYIFLA
jgi:hypothetical protein